MPRRSMPGTCRISSIRWSKDGALKIDWADEIVTGTLVAKDGELVHKMFKS